MAVGKPIIGAINGCCASFIRNNEIGYTCISWDIEALAKLIKDLNVNDLFNIGNNSKEVYFRKYSKSFYKLINFFLAPS